MQLYSYAVFYLDSIMLIIWKHLLDFFFFVLFVKREALISVWAESSADTAEISVLQRVCVCVAVPPDVI